MNGLEEIQEIIKNFIYEKQQMKQQIAEIESKRTQLAQERNEKKKINENSSNAYANYSGAEISELGKQIAELGNQSQELQNKLDSEFNGIKTQVNFRIDNLIAEEIRKIRKIEEEKQELEERIKNQEERSQKYEIQKQEFYARFGRIPELSENALRENKIQEEETIANKARIEKVEIQIENAQEELEKLANAKREVKNGNWSAFISETTDETSDAVDEDSYVIEESADEQIVEEVIEEQEIVEEAITLPLIAEENEQEETIQSIEEEPIEEINVEEFEPVEELKIEEFKPVEEIKVEEFEPVEELNVEPIEPIEELQVEEFKPVEEIKVEEFKPVEEKEPIREFKTFGVGDEEDDIDFAWQIQEDEEDNVEKIEPIVEETKVEESNIEQEPVDKIEEIARAIVEEIAAEQAKDIDKAEENVVEQTKNIDKAEEIEEKHENIQKIEEVEDETTIEEKEEEIIAFEEKEEPKEPISIFGEKVVLLNINAKFENGEVAYKALASNGDEIKVYPRKLATGNLLLKDKENREELKEILINYAVAEYRTLDKKVIKKIDPTVCEILVRFAKKYNYDAQNLIYNYAMSFSKNEESEVEAIPTITYNLSYMEGTDLSKKEKETITKICKNARKNEKIDIIGCTTGLSKIKYIFKRTFAANNANALPEGKY